MIAAADIALAHALADAAGDAIRPFFRAHFEIETKPDRSPVTEADRAAEAAMRRLIEVERPRDGIIGEEHGIKESESGRSWVLDPIDGTRSFIAGRPIFGTLIALTVEGWPVLGVIDQPVSRERWIGAMGRKTEFNGAAANTRPCSAIGGMRLATTSPDLFSGGGVGRFMALVAAIHREDGQGPSMAAIAITTRWSRRGISIWSSSRGSSSMTLPRSFRWSRARAGGCAIGRASRSTPTARATS